MEERLKNNLPYLSFLGVGVLALLLLGWAFVSQPMGIVSLTISGYAIVGVWSVGFWGVMAALLQIFVLLDIILLITLGIWGLLAVNGKGKELRLGRLNHKALGELAFIILAGLTLLVFICVLAFSNGAPGFGLFLNFLLIDGAFGAYMILWYKDIIAKEGLFICTTKRAVQPKVKAQKAKVNKIVEEAEEKPKAQVKAKVEEPAKEPEIEEETQTISFKKKED